MFLSTAEWILGCLAVCTGVIYAIRAYKPVGCSPIPGPRLHFGTRLLMFIQLHFLYTVPEFAEYWCQRYREDTVGVWMNGGYTIVTCDAELSKKILSGEKYSKNFIVRMGNDDGLKAIGMYKRGIIWNNDVAKWTLQRRMFQSGLAASVRDKASTVAAESARDEIRRIKTSVQNSSVPAVDLLNVLRLITQTVILDVALGINLDRERSQHLVDCIVEYFKAWEFFLLKPRFIWWLFPLLLRRHLTAVENLRQAIQGLVPMLDSQATPFLHHLTGHNLTPEEINQCLLEMVLAGTDTSSVTLYYTFLLLTENRGAEHELLDSWNDSFLEAVLRESMRMMPVGPVIIRRALADCEISGIPMQAGTNIVISLARLNRREKWFADPLRFNPRRFQENKDLVLLSAPMGLGPKGCVGQHIAMVEMKPVVRELLGAFKFLRLNEETPIINTKTKWDIAQQPVDKEILLAVPRKKIVLVGAHSVGKTTLARLVRDRTNAILVTETARGVMMELGMDAQQIKSSPQRSFELQAAIIRRQCEREEELAHEFAILDRSAIDALVYARKFCSDRWEELLDQPATGKCIERYRQDEKYVIFLIEPQKECLIDDGVRMMPEHFDEWIAFSELFKNTMDECQIPYHVLRDLDLEVRLSAVVQTMYST